MSALLGSGSGIKAGTVEAFAGNIPAGWLECNGAAISRAAYAKLFLAIGETYGAGDGATTFNLPDLRGEFIRGLDAGRGVDAGRVLGSDQVDSVIEHVHRQTFSANGGSASNVARADTPLAGTGSTFKSSGAFDSGNAAQIGETETRPRNIAMRYGIKY